LFDVKATKLQPASSQAAALKKNATRSKISSTSAFAGALSSQRLKREPLLQAGKQWNANKAAVVVVLFISVCLGLCCCGGPQRSAHIAQAESALLS